jgi:hypothetical protein
MAHTKQLYTEQWLKSDAGFETPVERWPVWLRFRGGQA